MGTNVGSTFYVSYAFNFNYTSRQYFQVNFPHTWLVQLISKLPFENDNILKSRQYKMLCMDTGNDFIQRDLSLRAFGSMFNIFLKMNNTYRY